MMLLLLLAHVVSVAMLWAYVQICVFIVLSVDSGAGQKASLQLKRL